MIKSGKLWQDERSHVLALLLLMSAVYIRVLNHGYVNFDDGSFVELYKNQDLSPLSFFFSFYAFDFIPLTLTSIWGEGKILGTMIPAVSHAISVGLHGLNVVLLFFVLRSLGFGGRVFRLLALTIFALHPLNVESVAWFTERKGLLSATFSLLSIYWYLKKFTNDLGSQKKSFVVSLIFYLLALFSKPVALMLPFVFVGIDYFKKTYRQESWLEKIPYFAVLAIFGFLHISARNSALALGSEAFNLFEQLALLPQGVGFYLSKFLQPFPMMVFYGESFSFWSPLAIVSLFAIGGILVAGFVRLRLQRRFFIFGLVWFLAILLPQLKVVPYGLRFMAADRYFYFSGIGLILIVSFLIEHLLTNWRVSRLSDVTLILVLGLGLGSMSFRQVATWESSVTLWTQVVVHDKKNALAENNLGLGLLDEGRMDEAMEAFQRATRIDPGYLKAWHNIAYVHDQRGEKEQALKALQRASGVQ